MVTEAEEEGGDQKLRVFTCEREVNEMRVWKRIYEHTANLNSSGHCTVIHFDNETGRMDSVRSYDQWSMHNPSSARLIAEDLDGCDMHSSIIFIKWGDSIKGHKERTGGQVMDEAFVRSFQACGGNADLLASSVTFFLLGNHALH